MDIGFFFFAAGHFNNDDVAQSLFFSVARAAIMLASVPTGATGAMIGH